MMSVSCAFMSVSCAFMSVLCAFQRSAMHDERLCRQRLQHPKGNVGVCQPVGSTQGAAVLEAAKRIRPNTLPGQG